MDKVRGNINRFSFATSPCPGLRELRYKEVKVYMCINDYKQNVGVA